LVALLARGGKRRRGGSVLISAGASLQNKMGRAVCPGFLLALPLMGPLRKTALELEVTAAV
jgi:hypothetical protein